MATLFQIMVCIGILIIIFLKYRQSHQKYLILVMLSGGLICCLKLMPTQLETSWIFQGLACLTLGLCCLSGWLMIKNQK